MRCALRFAVGFFIGGFRGLHAPRSGKGRAPQPSTQSAVCDTISKEIQGFSACGCKKRAFLFVEWMKTPKEETIMKKLIAVLLLLSLLSPCALALAEAPGSGYYTGTSTLLANLTHNCTNTGILLPEGFSPYQTTYMLSVGNNVSRPRFTPTAYDPNAVITVNGQVVQSGHESDYISIGNQPVTVKIVVSSGGTSTTYTIYIQRRPSEKRTRVSAGYINRIFLDKTTWKLDPDLVSISYAGEDYGSGSLSTFTNKTQEFNHRDYVRPLSPNCIYYYGTKATCYRARNLEEFMNKYTLYGSTLYTIIYLEDEIVAVMPYEADY